MLQVQGAQGIMRALGHGPAVSTVTKVRAPLLMVIIVSALTRHVGSVSISLYVHLWRLEATFSRPITRFTAFSPGLLHLASVLFLLTSCQTCLNLAIRFACSLVFRACNNTFQTAVAKIPSSALPLPCAPPPSAFDSEHRLCTF